MTGQGLSAYGCNPHSQLETPRQPQAMQIRLKKTKLCQFHMRGVCKDGAACRFAHGEEELQKQPDLSKTSMCRDFLAGMCTKGKNCQYAHSEDELRKTNFCHKTTPCIWYAMGKCHHGSQCRFAHGEADCNSSLNVVAAQDKAGEDRAGKKKEEKQQQQRQQPEQAKKLSEPMFIQTDAVQSMVEMLQPSPKYLPPGLSPMQQFMGYPMMDTTGAWNTVPMMQGIRHPTFYNPAAVPQKLPEPQDVNTMSKQLKSLTKEVQKLQKIVHHTRYNDSDQSTRSGAFSSVSGSSSNEDLSETPKNRTMPCA